MLAYVVSRLRPDVFTHPIWVHFGDREKQVSAETIEHLLSAAKQIEKDDPDSACQIMLICAVHQNYAGQRTEALTIMQQIQALAEGHDLADEIIWANWGACAICFQDGDTEQAASYLQRLQSCLLEQGEWMLANFVETVEQSLIQPTPTAKAGRTSSSSDRTHADLMCLIVDWLQQWGFSTQLSIPEFKPIPNSRGYPDRLSPAPWHTTVSDRHWRDSWYKIKQIVRGELRLQWVPNGAHRQASDTFQERKTYSPPPISGRIKSSASHVDQFPSQVRPQIGLAGSSNHLETSSAEAALLVYCLGPFRVYKNNQLIDKWPGNKCRQILKYLAVHRSTPVNQEVLTELFWPGIDLKGARRNLYQAIYSLRQALQNGDTEYSYILTEDNHYCINPDLDLWVDSDEFYLHYQNAQNLVGSGHQDAAIQEFQRAENLYQGEFLSEDRYEDWPFVHRENLKNAFLDALDQLSQHFYMQGQFSTSIYYSHKILEEDNCREDVHRRVMLCYMNLEQPHLALRQYHTCVEALREELDVPPMSATEELYKQIRKKRCK